MITPGISSPKEKPWCLSSASISFFVVFFNSDICSPFWTRSSHAPHKNRKKLCHSESSVHTLPSPVDSSHHLMIWLILGMHQCWDISPWNSHRGPPQSDVIRNAHKSCLIMIQNCIPSSAPWLRKMFTHPRGHTQTCSTIPQMWVWETPVSWSSDLHLHMGGATYFETLKGGGYI